MVEQQTTTVAPRGVLPFYFLIDYQQYSGEDGERPGDVAGLKVDVGDRLAATTIESARRDKTAFRSKICRRATAADILRYQNRGKKQRSGAEPFVAVEFERTVGQYRGPSADKRADIAGFPAAVARQYCEGYLRKGVKVGAVAHYYVDTVDEELEVPKETVDRDKPPAAKPRTRRRRQASPDSTGAQEKK